MGHVFVGAIIRRRCSTTAPDRLRIRTIWGVMCFRRARSYRPYRWVDTSAVVRAQSHAIGGVGQILDDSRQRQDSLAEKRRTAAGRNGEILAVMSGPGTARDWTIAHFVRVLLRAEIEVGKSHLFDKTTSRPRSAADTHRRRSSTGASCNSGRFAGSGIRNVRRSSTIRTAGRPGITSARYRWRRPVVRSRT